MEELKGLSGNLTLEQQFQLHRIKTQLREWSQEEAQDYVVEITRQMMIKDNLVKHLLKNA